MEARKQGTVCQIYGSDGRGDRKGMGNVHIPVVFYVK